MSASPPLTTPRRPDGWFAPGPAPLMRPVDVGPDEELSLLTGDWRILQRKDGHRWSLDDLVTAWLARKVALSRDLGAGPFLDLGTGIGSVALMMAWSFPDARVLGLEAQAISFGMASRAAVFNGCDDRVTFLHGDLRDPTSVPPRAAGYPLITGTPPYFDDPLQTRSTAPQKEPCRFETRGGVEDYLAAMARLLAPDGLAIVCHASRQRDRVLTAIATARLAHLHTLIVTPKEGRDPLVDVFVVAPNTRVARPAQLPAALTVRDADDQWTPAFCALRADMGLPPRRSPGPRPPTRGDP